VTSLPSASRRLLGLLVAPCLALATPGPLECRWTDVPPVIDGRADEPAWQRAALIGNFALPWLAGAPRAREGTQVRLLWDRTALYFHAELDDADVTAEVREHDGPLWENDVFELFLKPSPDHPGYFEFEVNPFGAILDAFFPDAESRKDRGQLRRGEFHVEAKVIIHGTLNDSSDRDRGWSVEGRIPWSDFNVAGGRPAPGETWTVNLCRINGRGRAAELSTAAPLAQPSFHRTAEYVPLRFAGPEAPPRVAWTNPRLHGSPDGPSGYATLRAWPRLDLHSPIAVAPEPGSDWLWFLEQRAGREGPVHVGRLRADGDGTGAETLLALDEIAYSLAFHPKYSENGYIYLGVNGPSARAPRFSRVVRYQVRAGRPDPASRTVIIEWPSDGHNGAALAFGRDGLLFVTSGDGSSHSDVHRVGQDPRDLRAKVLRIDPDRPAGGRNYSVPADNPFVDDPRFAPETWAYGLRNPWRLSYDAASDQLWTGENGQDAWEYARLVRRGENYGWSTFEGSHPFIASRPLGPHPVTPPTIEISHAEFRSLTGGVVYRGSALPELAGAYVFGDYGTGRVWAAKHDGRRLEWMRELIDTPLSLVHVTADAKGELVLADYGSSVWGKDIRGGIYRLERAPARPGPAAPFPRRLSEAGLFLEVAQERPAPGVIPYEVNVPGWHDGAASRHWLALPAGGTIEVRAGRVWEVPNGTALVQTLSAGGRRLETRLLLKEGNDWSGYTYLWDEAQQDAALVEKAGVDLALADGRPWRVPSRAECMMCHSREAGFALTLHEGQLNHGNQLAVWEAMGLLQVDLPAVERGRRGAGEGGRNVRPQPGQRRFQRTTLLPRSPEELMRYAPAAATDASLEVRARSYLAVNCAHCHVLNGGGNSAMDFQWQVPVERMRAVGEVPQHGDFEVAGARIIAAGDAGRSVLLARVASRGAGQMPPVGTRVPDGEGVRLLAEWIQSLRP
jgi:glucose/arabinose dehydrogenase/mono/diheme cytochrome c family protein